MATFYKISTLVLLIFSFAFKVSAQGKIKFEKTAHVFGDIKEEAGPADIEFKFKNEGREPLKLTSVRASCGCTTPEWSQDEIAPGAEGSVTASYNPQNRPGQFNKSITVKTDGDPEVVVLRISGNVIPRPKGVQDYYPMEIGNLRFKTTHVFFGDVMHNGTDTASTLVYNQGDAPVKLNLEASRLPSHITMTADNDVVNPKDTVRLSFTFDAVKKSDWGYNFDYFKLITDDADTPEKRLNISATIKENFGEISADISRPKVKFDKLSHDFGQVPQKDKVSTTFTITNEGDAPLLIRKTKASCGCTATKPNKTQLAPGESTTIDVTFSTGSYKGKQKKSLTVIVNDPARPMTTLWIESDVQVATTDNSNGGEE
ncbi:MAG: hypothetical protein CMO01_02500 [Thalassobius sp.]|nr:hypothetical protein [Thalassovita sp.]